MRKLALLFGIIFVILACGNFSTPVPTIDPNLIQTAIVQTAVQADALTQNANQTTTSTGKWIIATETSPVDDSQTVVLKLNAEKQVQGWLDKFLPTLIIRCKERKIEVYVYTGTQSEVESDIDYSTVRVRFDKEQAMTLQLSHSTDGTALFFPLISLQNIVDTFHGHNSMLFEFTPFNAPPANTTFDLRGIDEAIKPLAKACS